MSSGVVCFSRNNFAAMSEFVGPALPPGFQQESVVDNDESSSGSVSYGPSLPPLLAQVTPPSCDEGEEFQTREDRSSYGPCLPPGFGKKLEDHGKSLERANSVVVGPTLSPPGFDSVSDEKECDELIPSVPSWLDDEAIIGPLPIQNGAETNNAMKIKEQFESRSKAMKERLTGRSSKEEEKPQREDWMLVLPAEFKPSGIGARKFRSGVIDSGDRSVWTDTPADRLRKTKETGEKRGKKEVEDVPKSMRDKKLEGYVDEYNKKNRPESLMSMHRKRRAEELKEGGGVKERKPFNRETDLEVQPNLITPAKRKALMKDSKHSLHSKFTHGSRSFL